MFWIKSESKTDQEIKSIATTWGQRQFIFQCEWATISFWLCSELNQGPKAYQEIKSIATTWSSGNSYFNVNE